MPGDDLALDPRAPVEGDARGPPLPAARSDLPPLARNGTRAGRDLPLPFCSRFDLSIEDAPVASVQILIEAPKGWGAIAMH